MKNYLKFTLTGKEFLPLWLVFYVLFVVPYIILIVKMQTFSNQGVQNPPSLWFFLVLLLLIIIAIIITMFFAKIIIEKISLNEVPITCDYQIGKYLGVVFLGLFLSIITLGIYSPWFLRNLNRFFVNNASYKEHNFSFEGKGGKLFVIILLTVFVPMIILTLILIKGFGTDTKYLTGFSKYVYQMVVFLILVPYMYLVYKWFINIKYKEFNIKWDTSFLPSTGKFFLEVIITCITFGIYFPLAFIRLYKYFIERTQSNKVENQIIKFGYDEDSLKDFLLIWGQILLTIITLGIYYPWAFCKISGKILGKTYIEKKNI